MSQELKYSIAKPLIREGDVLLFRSKGLVSKLIRCAGRGPYSHVGLASWVINGEDHRKILECVEFREWKGGRSANLEVMLKNYKGSIDVYRPTPYFIDCIFQPKDLSFRYIKKGFDGRKVTNTMRKLLGMEYGWKRIWWIFKRYMVGLRLFYNYRNLEQNTDVPDIVHPVCSTAVAYCFIKNGYHLVRNQSYEWSQPCDIARSTRLSYLFTILP